MDAAIIKLLNYLSSDAKHTMWDYAVDEHRLVILCNLKKADKKKIDNRLRLSLKINLETEVSNYIGRWTRIFYTDLEGQKEFISFCNSYKMTPKKTKIKTKSCFYE